MVPSPTGPGNIPEPDTVLDEETVVGVAVASPLRQTFEYLVSPTGGPAPRPGARVRVPFGGGTRLGVVTSAARRPSVARHRLKSILNVIDSRPLLPGELLSFLHWASEYFHYPIGEVMVGTLPGPLRRGRGLAPESVRGWRLTCRGAQSALADLGRAPRQTQLVTRLRARPEGLAGSDLARDGGAWRDALRALVEREWVESVAIDPAATAAAEPVQLQGLRARVELNPAQRVAVEEIASARGRFCTFLLDGVTGSGKTEVYVSVIERLLDKDGQVLVLIPEIGLTPQLVERFRARLEVAVAVFHSGLTESERLSAWTAARDGTARVLIGTRSAVFLPFTVLRAVIVDEEHDLSYKQQDGFRYSARDLAVVRGRLNDVPVILGSATPSLESIGNVARGRYRELRLPLRAAGASAPKVEVVDLRRRSFEDGLSHELLVALDGGRERREQALLFVNRRGYAPVVLCHDCGWMGECDRCDAHLVLHREDGRLRCHHCGAAKPVSETCPACRSSDIRTVGVGTQRVAEALAKRLPQIRIARVDRDTMRRRGALEEVLAQVHAGEIDVLIGTQMLAKGHHFPNVTLVGILDADAGLFGADFRSPERMAQLLVQVSGRAGPGRATRSGPHSDPPAKSPASRAARASRLPGVWRSRPGRAARSGPAAIQRQRAVALWLASG